MPDEGSSETEIHVADEESPALTSYEPNFQRVFARGTLIRKEEDDENIIQLGFWSSKDTDVELPE